MQCITDETAAARITRISENGQRDQVTGTPTLVLNGRKLDDPSALTYAGLSRIVDQAIAGR